MTDKIQTRIPFNKTNLDAIPFATDGKQITYYDTNKSNLALRVGASSKTFIVYTRPKGSSKPIRITLGKYGDITIKHASDLATKELAKIAEGVNPIEEKKNKKQEQEQAQELAKANDEQTFEWMMTKYTEEHILGNGKKIGSSSTLANIKTTLDYFDEKTVMTLKQKADGTWENYMEVHLSSWLNRPFRSITRNDVLERFNVLEIARPARNQKVLQPIARTHQMSFKFASSAFNYIISNRELDIKENLRNPFDVMKVHNKWTKTEKRVGFVDFERAEFSKWWKAVEQYDYYKNLVSDYLLCSLLQAGRSIDLAPLQWKNVDMELKRIHYKNTKNNDDYTFPMSNLVFEIFQRRLKLNKDTVYVFEYPESKKGHIPQDCQHHFKVIAEISGKKITHHDLRRTWATAARKLKFDERNIDYCLKHKRNDINEHYFVRYESDILEILQTVEDFFIAVSKNELQQPVAQNFLYSLTLKQNMKNQEMFHESLKRQNLNNGVGQ